MTTAQDLIDYYKNLLIIQYNGRAKAAGTVGAFVSEFVADQAIQTVADGFDLATATGSRLDLLGDYRGANRRLYGLNLYKLFWATPTYANPSADTYPGFVVYADAPDVDPFIQVYGDLNTTSVMTDTDFRLFITYLARLHSMNFGLGEIDKLLYDFCGTYLTLADNEDMTITYTDDPSDPNHIFKILEFTNDLPAPAGVTVNIT